MNKYQVLHPDWVVAFLAVSERGSFTAGAAALNLSRSAVSERIKRLETFLGAKLLLRTTRDVTLSQIGRVFYQECRRLLDEYLAAIEYVRGDEEVPRGQLRVAALCELVTDYIAPLAVVFAGRHPDVDIELLSTERALNLIADHVDIMVCIGQPTDSNLRAIKLNDIRMCLVASPAYLAQRGQPKTPAELAQHELIVHSHNGSPWVWTFTGPDGEIEEVTPSARLSSPMTRIVHAMALAGGGLTVLPHFVVGEAIADGRLAVVMPAWTLPMTGIYAIYTSREHLPARVRTFIEDLRLLECKYP